MLRGAPSGLVRIGGEEEVRRSRCGLRSTETLRSGSVDKEARDDMSWCEVPSSEVYGGVGG